MNSNLRKEEIIKYIEKNLSATILELAEIFSVSHMTIRRDLEQLAKSKPIKIIHGGVIFTENKQENDYSMNNARIHMIEEKRKIARKAISLIEPDDTIFIDAGSTGEILASSLPTDFPITVICYALNIATAVSKRPNCSLILTGGYYHSSSMVFESSEGLDLMRHNRTKKAFITAKGISTELGITCSNYFECKTKQLAIASSQTKILISDSSKFGEIYTNYFSNIEDFDITITDSNLSKDLLEEIHRKGLKIDLA
jgi:DeoR family deoxyribose operon repressor